MTVLVAPFPDGEIGVTITDSSLPAVTASQAAVAITIVGVTDPSVTVSGPIEAVLDFLPSDFAPEDFS